MVTEKLEAAAEHLREAARKSRILSAAVGEPWEETIAPSRRGAWHRRILQESESGFFSRLFLNLRNALFAVRLCDFGLFLLTWGVVSAGISTTFLAFDWGNTRFWIPLAVAASALPLCFSQRAISDGLMNGFLTGKFLLGFCRLPVSLFHAEARDGRILHIVFAGGAAGVLSAFFHPLWFPVSMFGALLLTLAFAVPEITLIPMILAFPFLVLLPHPSLSLGVLALFSLVCRIPKIISGHRQDRFFAADFPILCFAALLLADGAISAAGTDASGALFAVYLLAARFAALPCFSSKIWRGRMIGCFLTAGSVCAGIGILQYLLGRGESRWMDLSRFGDLGGRVSATFHNPNILAIYLLAVFGVSLGGVFFRAKMRGGYLISLLLSAGCLIVTWTRGAWLGALAATVFFLMLHSRGSLVALGCSPLAAAGIIPWLPAGIRSRFASIGNAADSSSRYRLNTWKSVLRMIRAHPYGIGSGEQTFHAVYGQFAVSGTESVMHAHNLVLQMTAEHGVVGTILFLWIIGALFRRFFAIRCANSEKTDRSLTLGFASALVALLTMGLFDCLWYQPTMFYLFFWICAGMGGEIEETRKGDYDGTNEPTAEFT